MNFLPNEFYHIYNRGNNRQLIFHEEDNYNYFLHKMRLELPEHANIIAYCLMPNHYHILLYINPDTDDEQSNMLSRKLGTLQSSYTQGYNKRYKKTGSLFQQKIKAKLLNNNYNQAPICFHYIHQNPLKAGLVKNMEDWKYSSFREYLTGTNSRLLQKKIAYELLDMPEDKAAFLKESLGVIVFDEGYG